MFIVFDTQIYRLVFSCTCFLSRPKMPVALSTTKRKLHKILDSISNASSLSLASGNEKYNASTTTLPTITDSPAKKPRIERPVSAYVPPSTRITAKATSKARPLSAVQAPPSATMIDERKPPNFAPWDRSHFLTRLKTYRHVDKWRGKPEKINEVQWSKRGWSCVGKERVGCVGGCGKEVVILLETGREDKGDSEARTPDQLEDDEDEDDWRERAQAQLVEKYAELIISAHEGGCLWRRRGCDGMRVFTYRLNALPDREYRFNPTSTFGTSRHCDTESSPTIHFIGCHVLGATSKSLDT